MFIEEEGVKKINWRWMRRLFQWEKEIVEVCSGFVRPKFSLYSWPKERLGFRCVRVVKHRVMIRFLL
jgi:hypothetical protein